jgi:glycosyltransferase involved in cell wall biosynthesis
MVTRNGIDSSKFKDDPYNSLVCPKEKNPLKIVFPNSPDRGLDKVIRVLDYVREKHPVELHVFYGFDNMRKMNLNAQAEYYENMAKERPWVRLRGNVPHGTLLKEYKDASLWVYPTDFLETSCITALECVAKGVYPIVRNWGALPYTLASAVEDGMCQIIDRECKTESDHKFWADQVIKAIDEKPWTKIKVDLKLLDWESVAKEWLETLPKQG